jgi:hypothetical protein
VGDGDADWAGERNVRIERRQVRTPGACLFFDFLFCRQLAKTVLVIALKVPAGLMELKTETANSPVQRNFLN